MKQETKSKKEMPPSQSSAVRASTNSTSRRREKNEAEKNLFGDPNIEMEAAKAALVEEFNDDVNDSERNDNETWREIRSDTGKGQKF